MLILFDIDGTLLHASGAGRDATRAALLEVFGEAAEVDMHRFGGKTDWFTLLQLLEPRGFAPGTIELRMKQYDETVARHLDVIIKQRQVYALPGAMTAVKVLHQRSDVTLGVVTGNVASNAPIKLRAAGFDPDWFEVGAYGSEAIIRDELPRLAHQRAEALTGKTFPPSDVIVIGDTPADVTSARAFGAKSIAVLTGFAEREEIEAAKPDHILPDLTGLLPLLG